MAASHSGAGLTLGGLVISQWDALRGKTPEKAEKATETTE